MVKIFVSTAEPSAELHAASLVRELHRQAPDCQIEAAGGSLLAGAGARLAVDMSGRAVMGFWETVHQLSFYRRALASILANLEQDPPDALVLLDAPSFHLHLARQARRLLPSLPIIYYIAPKLWAWKKWRARHLRRYVNRVFCIFPFEEEFFRGLSIDATYVGNPTFDHIRDLEERSAPPPEGLEADPDPRRGVLAVFPGSRDSEIKYLWPEMAAATAELRRRFPDLRVAVSLAPGMEQKRLLSLALAPTGTRFIAGSSGEILRAASLVLAKSGTTTLEAALLGRPMVVAYASHPVSYFIARAIVNSIPYFSLPNILAGRKLVPELLQDTARAVFMAEELGKIITDPGLSGKMREELLDLRRHLGSERADQRTSREILSLLGKGES
ncbi:MAG: lipid-A-disaccharide synthase [Planctomycetota bacterium]|jgi:lipid-A-disaccharide synthase|nr:lipid-A-disaccharide synthase [Planctomycetota bacterium]